MSNTKPTPYGFAIIAHGVFQKFVRCDDVAAEVLAQCVASDPNATAIPLCAADALTVQAATIAEQAHQLRAAKTIIAGLEERAVLLAGEYSSCQAQVHDIAGQRAANAALTDEIEALRADAERRKAALLNARAALVYHREQTRPISRTDAAIDDIDAALQASEPTQTPKE